MQAERTLLRRTYLSSSIQATKKVGMSSPSSEMKSETGWMSPRGRTVTSTSVDPAPDLIFGNRLVWRSEAVALWLESTNCAAPSDTQPYLLLKRCCTAPAPTEWGWSRESRLAAEANDSDPASRITLLCQKFRHEQDAGHGTAARCRDRTPCFWTSPDDESQ